MDSGSYVGGRIQTQKQSKDMNTKNVQYTAKKWNKTIVVRNFPDTGDAKLEKFALKYFLFHECGDAIRNGQSDFDWKAEKTPKERGPVQMKTETLQKKLEERMEADPALELRIAAERLAKRKGIEYSDAKQSIMDLWGVDEDGMPVD